MREEVSVNSVYQVEEPLTIVYLMRLKLVIGKPWNVAHDSWLKLYDLIDVVDREFAPRWNKD